jgi:hypothetical protein
VKCLNAVIQKQFSGLLQMTERKSFNYKVAERVQRKIVDAIAGLSTLDILRRTLDAGQARASICWSPVGHASLAVAPFCYWPTALSDIIFG